MRSNRGLKATNEYGYRGQKKPKHTHTFPKKRVRVTLYDGDAFTDHYLRVEGRFHLFRERGRVKSSTIYQMNILTKADEIQGIKKYLEKRNG
jgi:hypothetical protein